MYETAREVDKACDDLQSAVEGSGKPVPSMQAVLADPSTSFWLSKQIAALQHRDALDAARDARLLADLFEARVDALLGGKIGKRSLLACAQVCVTIFL